MKQEEDIVSREKRDVGNTTVGELWLLCWFGLFQTKMTF